MNRRMITMNVKTCEISFTDLTTQEMAELQAITEDYRRRFDSPHPLKKPVQDQTAEMKAIRTADVAI